MNVKIILAWSRQKQFVLEVEICFHQCTLHRLSTKKEYASPLKQGEAYLNMWKAYFFFHYFHKPFLDLLHASAHCRQDLDGKSRFKRRKGNKTSPTDYNIRYVELKVVLLPNSPWLNLINSQY